jgi:hypothetical protein
MAWLAATGGLQREMANARAPHPGDPVPQRDGASSPAT